MQLISNSISVITLQLLQNLVTTSLLLILQNLVCSLTVKWVTTCCKTTCTHHQCTLTSNWLNLKSFSFIFKCQYSRSDATSDGCSSTHYESPLKFIMFSDDRNTSKKKYSPKSQTCWFTHDQCYHRGTAVFGESWTVEFLLDTLQTWWISSALITNNLNSYYSHTNMQGLFFAERVQIPVLCDVAKSNKMGK